MTKLRGVGVGLVFLVGCAVGGAASRFSVPPASAQQAASLTKWEYACFANDELDELVNTARKLGREGWEMVTAGSPARGYPTWCFKRPIM
jgi:hypothetical protein